MLSRIILLLALISGPFVKVCAQDYIPIFTRDYSSGLSVEIDPITYLLRGYSIHLRYQPMFSQRVVVGAGTYAMDFPDALTDFNSENRDRGWNVRIRSAYALFGEYYAKEAYQGWFVGEQIALQTFKVSNDMERQGSASFNSLLLMTYGGYCWHPNQGALYIKPWVGLGYTTKVDGINKVGTLTYKVGPFMPFLTFHVGYTF